MKKQKQFYIIVFSFCLLLVSCPFMEKTYGINYLAFKFSKEEIRINEPVDLVIKYCSGELDKDEVYIIQKLNDVDMQLLEGTLLECDDESVLFVDFVRPENQIESDSEENDDFVCYCKLSLIFKKAGTYDFCIKRTDKNNPVFVFHACIHETITVTD